LHVTCYGHDYAPHKPAPDLQGTHLSNTAATAYTQPLQSYMTATAAPDAAYTPDIARTLEACRCMWPFKHSFMTERAETTLVGWTPRAEGLGGVCRYPRGGLAPPGGGVRFSLASDVDHRISAATPVPFRATPVNTSSLPGAAPLPQKPPPPVMATVHVPGDKLVITDLAA